MCSDPRYEVGFVGVDEFPEVYDLVEAIFDTRRPRRLFEWIYERNPKGVARVIVVREKSSRRMVSCAARYPWPIASADEPVDGVNGGDWGTLKDLRGKGMRQLQAEFRAGLRCEDPCLEIGWPNARAVAAGAADKVTQIGVISRMVLPLRLDERLQKRGWPAARFVGSISEHGRNAWLAVCRLAAGALRVESVRRFDAAFDEVTARHMATQGYWCPHSAEFLNWRYLDHPTYRHAAFAALGRRDELLGYCVVRCDGPRAWLMDFAAPADRVAVGLALLSRAVATAVDAGCEAFEFAATQGWQRWSAMRWLGMVERPSEMHFFATAPPASSVSADRFTDVRQQARWQCVLGDTDAL